MDNQSNTTEFYEEFWEDSEYQQSYALEVGVRDRVPAIKKVWGKTPYPKKVLDFGCGNGVLTNLLKEEGFGEEILGIDVSETGIAYATKKFSKAGLSFDGIESVDSAGINSFDAIVSSHVFEHIENPNKVLSQIKNKAVNLIIEVPLERCFLPSIISFLTGKNRKDNRLGHVNFWNKKTFRQFIESEGLCILNDFHYASAPFSRFNHWTKRFIERVALRLFGLRLYSKMMATHYIVITHVSGDLNA